jgi:hypothetical protein
MHVMKKTDRLQIGLAEPSDDAELRTFLRENPSDGPWKMAFLREPSFVGGAAIEGKFIQIPIVRLDGRIVAIGTRAIRSQRVNGVVEDVGYLGDLRVDRQHRRGILLRSAYRLLKELDTDERCRFYTSVVGELNDRALGSIAANRADLPTYVDCGRVLVPAIDVRSTAVVPTPAVIRGSLSLLPEIVDCLNSCQQQFAAVYSLSDFESNRFPGFAMENFYLVMRKHRVVSVLGLWDQRSFRQTVSLDVPSEFQMLWRAFGNHGSENGLISWVFPVAYVCFVATNSVEDYQTLLRRALWDAAELGISRVVVGLHERDPRVDSLRIFSKVEYAVRLFLVTYRDVPAIDDRIPCFDPAFV